MKSQRPSQGHFAVSKTELYQKEQKQKKKKNRVKKAVLVGPDQCEIYSEVRRHVGVTSEKKKKKCKCTIKEDRGLFSNGLIGNRTGTGKVTNGAGH